jgi:hypothetical protein
MFITLIAVLKVKSENLTAEEDAMNAKDRKEF